MTENEVTERVIGAAIEVHRHLGPGLLESAYEECLCYELNQLGLRFQRQVHLPIHYKDIQLESAYRMDLVVEDLIVVEIKSSEEIARVHSAQVLTYLKASNKRVGLLINFNVPVLTKGLKRIVNLYAGPVPKTCVSAPSALRADQGQPARSVDPPFSSSSPRLRVSASSSTPTAQREGRS